MNHNVFPMSNIDLKRKNAIYPESGISLSGMFPILHILPFDFKCKFVPRWAGLRVRVSMVRIEGSYP